MEPESPESHPELGQFIMQCRPKDPRKPLPGLVVGGLVTCGSLALIISSPDLDGALLFGIFLLAGLGTASSARNLFNAVRHRQMRVQVYDEGFTWSDAEHDQEVFRWEAIDRVWKEVIRYRPPHNQRRRTTQHIYTIARRGGGDLKVSSRQLDGIAAFGKLLLEHTTEHLLPQYLAALQRGETIDFGRVAITTDWIDNGKERLAWIHAERVHHRGGAITIDAQGQSFRWLHLQERDVPNPGVFVALLNQLAGVKR